MPGDVLLISEGNRVCADARIILGDLEVDLSTLTGESLPVARSADQIDTAVPILQARELVFSGRPASKGKRGRWSPQPARTPNWAGSLR